MDDIENRLREMNERIDRQEREATSRQENIDKNTNGKPTTANNKPNVKQKPKPPKPKNNAKFGGKQFQNRPAPRNYTDGNRDGGPAVGCMFEEIQVTRRIYNASGDPRSHFSKPLAPTSTGFGSAASAFGGFENFGANMFQNNYSPHNRNSQRSDFSAPARKPPPKAAEYRDDIFDDPKVINLRQNHMPFVIAKAFKTRSCVACHRAIARNSIFIVHKEIEVSRHPTCHWKLMLSENPNSQFYHLDRACLEMRRFDRDYLDLICDVVVNKDVPASAASAIKRCGLFRPTMNNEQSLATVKVTVGLNDLKLDDGDGEATVDVAGKDVCDDSRSDRDIFEGVTVAKDDADSVKVKNTKINFASDSDDDYDKL